MIGANGKKFTKVFSMIKKVKRSALDLDKYTACLQHSINYRVYAEYWYLDTLTNLQWNCLVLNDYEAVMPLPFQKKFGVKLVSQPLHCQQLGVFHSNQFTSEQFKNFLKKFSKNIVRGYHFNEENRDFFEENIPTKINQILDLNVDYSAFRSKLRKNRKQELAKGLPPEYKIVTSETDQHFINLLEREYHQIQNKSFFTQLKLIVNTIQSRKLGITISIFKENQVVASSFYIKSGNRLVQLCNSKQNNSIINFNTYIVDYVIKEYHNKAIILDFEGSSIKGVHEFNTSFRAITKEIPIYKSKFFN